MAARYFVGGGTGNWNSTTNWAATDGGASGASFPIAGDTVFLTAASGANTLTVNTTSACTSITCTGFTGTLAGTSQLTVAGSVTLVAGMTFTWSGLLIITATNTFTSNGKALNGGATFSSAGTLTTTLADDLTVTGTMTCSGAGSKVFNGNVIYLATSLSSSSAVSGTTQFIMNGTGTLNTSDTMNCNFDINTAGGITIANFEYSTGTFRVISGSNTHTGNLFIPITATLDTGSLIVNNLDIDQNATVFLSDCYMVGELQLGRLGNALSLIGFNIYCSGNLNIASTSNIISGTTNIIMNGTGSIRSNGGTLRLNLTINTAGTITFITNFFYNTGTFTYTAGTVVTGIYTLTIGTSVTLNTVGITWNNISITAAAIVTLNSLLTIGGILTLPNANVTFSGSSGFSINTLSLTTSLTASRFFTVVSGVTYSISDFTVTGSSNTFRYSLVSSTPGVQAIFTLSPAGSQNVMYTDATDIDSSAGQTIWSFQQVVSNTLNWGNLNVSNIGGGGTFTFAN